MQPFAQSQLALARLIRQPGTWISLWACFGLGPALSAFQRQAPIGDDAGVDLLPWLFLAALVGVLMGSRLIPGTEQARRASVPTTSGDFLFLAIPALLMVLAALLSLRMAGAEPPSLLALASTLQLAALGALLLPAGPLALLAITWVLPPLFPSANLSPLLPFGPEGTSIPAVLAFSCALLLLTTLRPYALRSSR